MSTASVTPPSLDDLAATTIRRGRELETLSHDVYVGRQQPRPRVRHPNASAARGPGTVRKLFPDVPLGRGQLAVDWLRKLKHPKSPAPGHPFQLDPWQENVIRRIYGPRDEDGGRIVRCVVLLLPRGSRKTSLAAAITLLHLVGPESLPGGLIVSAASAHEQAMELYNEATAIIHFDQRLAKHLSVREYVSRIACRKRQTRYVAVASDGKVQHGKTPNVVIADELHAWEGRAGMRQ